VFINASGYADDDTATGVNGFAGIAVSEVDNSSGSNGDLTVEVYTVGDFELTGAGSYSQANVGDVIYGDDNYTINTSIGSASIPIGLCVGYISTTKLMVRLRACGDGALPVAALTTITPADAAGTPDYAIAAVTNSSAYGFSNAAEAITLLYVIQNLQKRVLDLEKRTR
jgi:pectate lyase